MQRISVCEGTEPSSSIAFDAHVGLEGVWEVRGSQSIRQAPATSDIKKTTDRNITIDEELEDLAAHRVESEFPVGTAAKVRESDVSLKEKVIDYPRFLMYCTSPTNNTGISYRFRDFVKGIFFRRGSLRFLFFFWH